MEEKTQEDILLELLEKRTDWEAIRNPFGKGVYFRAGELFGQKFEVWPCSLYYTSSWFGFPNKELPIDTGKIKKLHKKLVANKKYLWKLEEKERQLINKIIKKEKK